MGQAGKADQSQQCDGYAHVAQSREDIPPRRTSSSPNFPLPEYRTDDVERRCIDYFCSITVFELIEFDHEPDFWRVAILQAARQDPVIHHSLLALSSTHERFHAGDTRLHRSWLEDEATFALKHYNQAISLLVNPPEGKHPPIDVCLMGCLLFATIEVSQYSKSLQTIP